MTQIHSVMYRLINWIWGKRRQKQYNEHLLFQIEQGFGLLRMPGLLTAPNIENRYCK